MLNSKKNFLVAICVALSFCAVSTTAMAAAATEPVDVEVRFVVPITLTETAPLQFGLVDKAFASGTDTLAVDTGGTLTGTNTAYYMGPGPNGAYAPASITVDATAGESISIGVAQTTAGANYTIDTFKCKYALEAEDTGCNGGSTVATSLASGTLLIGGQINGQAGTPNDGDDFGVITVTVNYQ